MTCPKVWRCFCVSVSVWVLAWSSGFESMASEDESSRSLRETPTVRIVRELQPAVAAIYSYRTTSHSSGSGSVIDPRGYVLTVAHVVGDQHVVLLDGRAPLRASLVGSDDEFDIAILKMGQRAFDRPASPAYPLDGTPPTFMPLGIADEIMLGESILNIGSPGGRGIVVTTGIVSATRFVGVNALSLATQSSDGFKQYLQFDAASNPGNSGGAIVNMDGQQIGVVTSSIRGEEGIHFAVPIETVRRCVPTILHSELRNRYVSGIEIDPQINEVIITGIDPNSPAAEQGLRVGDQIMAVQGRRLRDPIDWELTKLEWRADQTIDLTVLRGPTQIATESNASITLSPRQRKPSISDEVATAPGLRCRTAVYDPRIADPLSDENRPANAAQVIAVPTATPAGLPREDHYELLIEGLIELKEDGLYRLGTNSDDGSRVYFHNELVVDNGSNHAPQLRTGWIDAAAGKHPIRIEYYEDEGGQELELYVAAAGEKPRPVVAEELFHVTPPQE